MQTVSDTSTAPTFNPMREFEGRLVPVAGVWVIDRAHSSLAFEARHMVAATSKDEPEILQRDFFNSLCAAFEPDEVRAQLADAGLAHLQVHTHEPFHLSISGLLL